MVTYLRKPMSLYCLLLVSAFVESSYSIPASCEEIKIGVYSHFDVEQTMDKWQPTADYLSAAIPQYTFVMVPYANLATFTQAAVKGEIDFVLTNPSSYIDMELHAGASRILTLCNKRGGEAYTQFGSVIFTRASREDITSAKDLKGKVFVAVDEKAFGGWQVAWFELKKNGINPYKDFTQIRYASNNQERVVYTVLDDKADAGSVRTDMLERMAESGKISLSDIKVINQKFAKDFKFLRSTDLYPEWPFAKLRHIPDALATEVAIALLQMSPDTPAAISGKYVGWTVPLNYQPAHQLLKDLRVGPYKVSEPDSIVDIITRYWFSITIILVVFFSALVISYVVIMTNQRLKATKSKLESGIAERKKVVDALKQSQRMLKLVLDNIPVRVFWKDRESTFLGCNRLFAQDSGLSGPNELIGKNDYDMAWSNQAELYRADDKAIIKSCIPKLNYEEPQTTPEGKEIWLKTSKIPLTDDNGCVVGVLGAYEDITQQKLNENKIEEYSKHLEEMVKDRTVELELSNKELESYSYSIAHDLRSPLRSIVSFSQILLEDTVSKLSDNELDALNRIIISGKHMAELIDDILELSRITRTKLHKTSTDISQIYHEIVDNYNQTKPNSEIDWQIEDNIITDSDKKLMKVMLQNFVDNSLKFTQKDNKPVIKFGKQIRGQSIVYYVEDNGVGFDMNYSDKLFRPFQRLHSNEFEGTGIGLATVQRIVHRHGGNIWAESKPDHGATFYFTLTETKQN